MSLNVTFVEYLVHFYRNEVTSQNLVGHKMNVNQESLKTPEATVPFSAKLYMQYSSSKPKSIRLFWFFFR